MRGDAVARIDKVDLAVIASLVRGDELLHDSIRCHAFAEEAQTFCPVKRINKRLSCNGSDPGADERHPGASRKELRCNGNAETAVALSWAMIDQVMCARREASGIIRAQTSYQTHEITT
jgi:hypothetical protein